jgi:signal transduction histidine kinase
MASLTPSARYGAAGAAVVVAAMLLCGLVLIAIDREVDAQMADALANQRIHIEKSAGILKAASRTYVLILERWLRPLPERGARELAIEQAVGTIRHATEEFSTLPALNDEEATARNQLVTAVAMWSNRVHRAIIASDGPNATGELRSMLDGIDEASATVIDIDSRAGTSTDKRVSALHSRQAWAQGIFGSMATGILLLAVAWWNGKTKAERGFQRAEQARAELERVEKMRSQFFANTSHELRTPLVAIRGFTALLVDASEVTDARDLGIRIDREAADLLGQIDNILDAAKLARGGMEVILGDVDVAEVVRRCIQRCTPLVAAKPLLLSVEVASELPAARSDPVKLGHVLTNLVANAIKFTSEGHVAVRARAPAGAERVVIEVEDTGVGIPEEALGRIWNPFEQADATVSRRFGGTGLGLSIVRGLLDKMGGEVTVTSTVGKGTTFAVALPVARGEEARG